MAAPIHSVYDPQPVFGAQPSAPPMSAMDGPGYVSAPMYYNEDDVVIQNGVVLREKHKFKCCHSKHTRKIWTAVGTAIAIAGQSPLSVFTPRYHFVPSSLLPQCVHCSHVLVPHFLYSFLHVSVFSSSSSSPSVLLHCLLSLSYSLALFAQKDTHAHSLSARSLAGFPFSCFSHHSYFFTCILLQP